MAALGYDAPKIEVDALFDSIDADESGLIDYEELKRALSEKEVKMAQRSHERKRKEAAKAKAKKEAKAAEEAAAAAAAARRPRQRPRRTRSGGRCRCGGRATAAQSRGGS